MPIIVEEVVISVEVTEEPARPAPGSSDRTPQASSASDRQAIVEECVERVLQILRDSQEP
ncbi:MAG: DUF5908 family protein [Phycisphaerales bacterium]